jgi:hypothetical protein
MLFKKIIAVYSELYKIQCYKLLRWLEYIIIITSWIMKISCSGL